MIKKKLEFMFTSCPAIICLKNLEKNIKNVRKYPSDRLGAKIINLKIMQQLLIKLVVKLNE